MIKVCELKKPYVKVGSSYGGSQSFFSGAKGFFEKQKAKAGCGVVAMSDVLGYLLDKTEYTDPSEYKLYFNSMAKRMLWIPNRFGMTIYRIMLLFPHLLRNAGLSLRCRWGISGRKLPLRIEEMIRNDIPVILNVPKLSIPPKNRRDKLNFYILRDVEGSGPVLTRGASTAAHFVVVTGVFREGDKTYYQISSWGKKYYIDADEFAAFTKKTLLGGVLGNILYIRKTG